MRYWWVNQNQTYAQEVKNGFLWSPKKNKNGAKNVFYENMTRIEPGDVVFSFCDRLIKAIGVAVGAAKSSVKPVEFGTVGSNWSNEGWYVPVKFTELQSPIRPKDHINALRPTLPEKYSPLQFNGNGRQNVYLAELPEVMAFILIDLLRGQVESIITGSMPTIIAEQADDLTSPNQSWQDITETERHQLTIVRCGQAIYRARLESIEKCCRITGVSERNYLRASHLKPWRDSTDVEKLDGNNGLLLSPHVDHLLDRGFISFTDSGEILISPQLDPTVLKLWGLNIERNVGLFNSEQRKYLAYHREHVFLK